MSNPTTLKDLRELRELLGRACALVEGMRALRTIGGIADIAPDLTIAGAAADVPPELLAKLAEHVDDQEQTRELDDHVEGLLSDARALLDGAIKSLDAEG